MERRTRSQHNEVNLLPFSGLGIALPCVNARAEFSRLVPIAAEAESPQQPLRPDFMPICNGYGFRLLIALGREIRGR
ncbi:hypothetical protein [Halodesulfovibrio marinisediminis]|uniref:Uncharacterized protein n=1 Tax=Halodesulfovibrio marinisediminis DSM 17456 TaxID=1121457 RepID=A0A1N6HAL2_9BACT|nr:hypothetical protein [Halodesulfovibrio marinisediminis]SIO16878.1 hypothetical protein SAMN02745161_2106 [Halodesulfovibrio marinisediminis DSM 17456]